MLSRLAASFSRKQGAAAASTMASSDFYNFTVKDIAGQDFAFEQLRGKVVIIVNVASKCGFTPQYTGLQKLYDDFKEKGLAIIGFPCNQFGQQEPGQPEEIVEFCSRKYSVSFPILEKVDVNGDNAHPVYQYLKKQKTSYAMELVKWNFEKFVIDKQGNVVERFSSAGTPEQLRPVVEKLLAQQ